MTGDVAYSGKDIEYEAAKRFFIRLKELIEDEVSGTTDILFVPGNHDCDLAGNDKVRSIIIDHVIDSPETAEDDGVIESCTSCQESYFKFRDSITSSPPIFDHKLWSEYEFQVAGKNIRISAINVSWMSRVPEIQGKLVFPIEMFDEQIGDPSNLRIVMIHHPLNWYCQATYHPFKSKLWSCADAILSGHEHTLAVGEINDSEDGRSLYFEAPALQQHNNDSAENKYSILQFDLDNNHVKHFLCTIMGFEDSKISNEATYNLPSSDIESHGLIGLSDDFKEFLNDPGGNFTHPEKEKITFEDVFVYPDLQSRVDVDEVKVVSSRDVIQEALSGAKIHLSGGDKSGKSSLLLRTFADLHAEGMVPLYICAPLLRSVSEKELEKAIKRIAENQYKKLSDFEGAKKAKRIALVDDIDSIPGGPKNQHRAVLFMEKHFGSVYLTTSTNYDLTELVDREVVELIKKYADYEIKDFGHRMRHKLIKKWCLCGNVATVLDLDERVHALENIMATVLGKNLVPPRPLYLLILLQSSETHSQGDLQNSQFSYYYQYLITKSLGEAGATPDKFNEIFNYLSQLAWFYKSSGSNYEDISSLRRFNRAFSDKYTEVEFEARIDLLCRAKLLYRRGEEASFSYPYIYYFFVGKYLADNLHLQEVRDFVISSCESLHKKENANTILFLTHHRNDPWVVEQISSRLHNCFSEMNPMEFGHDVDSINGLIESAAQLVFEDTDVGQNQELTRSMRDELDDSDVDEPSIDEDGASAAIEFSKKFLMMKKTAELLGQVTRNYYGSIERAKKAEYLGEVFDAPMRGLRIFIEVIMSDPDAFVAELSRVISEKSSKEVDENKLKQEAKTAAFNIMGLISTGMILQTAQQIVSEKLRDDICNLVDQKNNNAYSLIGAATRLIQPGRLPFSDLEKLAKKIQGNSFAFRIFQSMVVYHLHMFHMTEIDKQKLCSISNINLQASKAIDMQSRGKKFQ